MTIENTVDKVKLIADLKEIHKELFTIYKELFDFKYKNNEDFKIFIDSECKDNGISDKDKKSWNDNFCHRASYTLLNKILFVRICEDKGFMLNDEDYIAGEKKDPDIGKKLSRKGLQKWNNLITNYTLGELVKFAFDDMKKSYSNIILYKEDKYEILNPTDEELAFKYIGGNDGIKNLILAFERVLEDIIEKLDSNKFNFKYTDGNILGDVYEKFMDRETRKAIGQFYTPEFVIEYILKNTVEEADVIENPFVTVADISCGSGHFLIMAYDILKEKFLNNLEKLREKYTEETYKIKKNGVETEVTGKEYWVKENIHYHILKHCIYGADLDSFAVQLTTINLLLKDLDNFTDELNIIECDSLIKWEEDYDWKDLKEQLKEEFEVIVTTQSNLFGEEEKIEIKQRKENYKLKHKNLLNIEEEEIISIEKANEIIGICQFWSNKFNYVVGNPPYITALLGKKQSKLTSYDVEKYYKEQYPNSSQYKLNLYALFIERAITVTTNKMGYIIPSSILTNYYFQKLRKFILDSTRIDKIFKFNYEVFEDAVTGGNVILNLGLSTEKATEHLLDAFEIYKYEEYENGNYKVNKFNQDLFNELPNLKFLTNVKMIDFIIKMKKESKRLGDIAVFYNGIKTGDNKKFLSDKKINEKYKPVIRGRDVFKYSLNESGIYVYFDKDKLWSNTNEAMYTVDKKIIVRQTSDSIIGTIDLEKKYTMDTTHLIIPNDPNDIYCILGILNSRVMDFYYKQIVPELDKAFAEVKISNLKELPIKLNDKRIAENISEDVKNLIDCNCKIKELQFKIKDSIEGINSIVDLVDYIIEIEEQNYKVKKLEQKIDKEVYLMYELDNEYISDNFEEDSTDININELLPLLKSKNIDQICQEYTLNYLTVWEARYEKTINLTKEEMLNYYNLILVYDAIEEYLYTNIINHFKQFNKYKNISELNSTLKNAIIKYDLLMNIMKKEDITKRYEEIIKDSLSKETYTWNAYRKDLDKDKVNKTFVKYYDTNYYGLAEWSDEIHKKYFMYAIEEYTLNNPNQKKANDILKLFKELNIGDKEDYIDTIKGMISKAFK